MAPADFVPLAEGTGLIISIGQWMLREACRQVRAWQLARPSDTPLTLSVNLSARQFQHSALLEQVGTILRETGLEPTSLKFEITESTVMQDAGAAEATLQQLKEHVSKSQSTTSAQATPPWPG